MLCRDFPRTDNGKKGIGKTKIVFFCMKYPLRRHKIIIIRQQQNESEGTIFYPKTSFKLTQPFLLLLF